MGRMTDETTPHAHPAPKKRSWSDLSDQEQDVYLKLCSAVHFRHDEASILALIADPNFPGDVRLSPNARFDPEKNPLKNACQFGMERVALALISRGIDLNKEAFTKMDDNPSVTEVTKQFSRTVVFSALASITDVIQKFDRSVMPKSLADRLPHGQVNTLNARSKEHLDELLQHAKTWLFRTLCPPPPEEDMNKVNRQVEIWRREGRTPAEIEKLLETDALTRPVMQQFFRPLRLSRCWHHPAIYLPQELQPLAGKREWYPILPQPFTASNGLRVTCLTQSAELEEESRLLNHCIGRSDEYISRCCNQKERWFAHIFSIGRVGVDGTREPMSTVLAGIVDQPAMAEWLPQIPIADTGMALCVLDHHAKNGSINLPAEVRAAWGEFAAALSAGTLSLTLDNETLGETKASIEKNKKFSPFECMVGYVPNHAHTEALFDRFRMSERAAVTTIRPDGMRVYDVMQAGGYTHYEHFIDGWAVVKQDGTPTGRMALRQEHLRCGEDERLVYLRDLGLDDWLRATGLMNMLYDLLHQYQLTPKPLDNKIDLHKPPRPIPTGKYEEKKPRPQIISGGTAMCEKPSRGFVTDGGAPWREEGFSPTP
jgi:hypothetical protein